MALQPLVSARPARAQEFRLKPLDRALRAVARACVGAGLALVVWTLWSGYHVARGDWRPLPRRAPTDPSCCVRDAAPPRLVAQPQATHARAPTLTAPA